MKALRSHGAVEATDDLYSLACKPDRRVSKYTGCIVDGVRFTVKDRDDRLTTQNSGVLVYEELEDDDNGCGDERMEYYGILDEVVELNYIYDRSVVLFKCTWFDTDPKKKWVRRDFHFTSINVSHKWYEDDSYVLAYQAKQVFYIDDPKLGANWKVIQKVQHRHLYDIPEKIEEDQSTMHDAYQANHSDEFSIDIDTEVNDQQQLHRVDVEPEVVQFIESSRVNDDDIDFLNDDSESEMSDKNCTTESEDIQVENDME